MGEGPALDNLTHSLTGLALSRAGLNRLSPHATLVLILAANAPDIDVIAAAGGPLAFLDWHRHITHAAAAAPLMALLPVAIAYAIYRRKLDLGGAYLASLAGVVSHFLLDLTNVYGVRLALPFSSTWYRPDILNVVDFWIWALLLFSVAAPALARLVGSEIGVRERRKYPGRLLPLATLALISAYIFGRSVLHSRAVNVLESRIYDGLVPRRAAAFPSPFQPFRWRGLVETEDFYSLYDLHLLAPFDPGAGRVLYRMQPSPAIDAARATPEFRRYLAFAQFPFWRVIPVEEPAEAVRVECMDLRFADPPQARFVARAIVDRTGRVQRAWFEFGIGVR